MKIRLLFLSAVVAVLALAGATPGSAPPFQSGDTVCWVGDSITHSGSYHAMVELFYATRFPDRVIRSYNEGIGGDRAVAIMSDEKYRLNVDILAHKPTVATIMLGMNDVGRNDYGSDKTGPDIEKRRQASLATYDDNMRKLMDSLTKSGARLILIEPSIYDETTKLPTANAVNAVGSNAAIGQCAQKIEVWAKEYHAGIVDFYDAMNEIDLREQKKDPAFTLIGADRIHPGPVGHFVMAYTFLKAQGMPREVASIDVNAKKGTAGAVSNAQVEHVLKIAAGVQFDALEKALPFVTPDAALPALGLVPFDQELNQETLTVAGLAKGRYRLRIDGADVAEYSSEELKAGVNLAGNQKTPQYQQSAAATKISLDRTKTGAAIRDIVAQKYGLSKMKVDATDNADIEKRMHDQIMAARQANKPVNKAWDAVLADLAEPGKLQQHYDDLSVDLLKACQPKEHHFVIERKQ